jgi:hypothetical protein
MTNINNNGKWVQTIEGIVKEKYPYEDAPESVQVRGAYQTGFLDGFALGMVVCALLVFVGYVLSMS